MKKALEVVLFVLIFAFVEFLGWLLTCGILKAICICFGLAFSWKIATGIWLVLSLISAFLRNRVV